MKRYLTVVLICVSLLTNNIKYLFIVVFHLFIFLEKCLHESLFLFIMDCFFFCCWVLDVLLLLDIKTQISVYFSHYIWFISISSHCVYCLFTLFLMSFESQKVLILMGSRVSFPLFICAYTTYVRNHCQIQIHKDLPLCFLLHI